MHEMSRQMWNHPSVFYVASQEIRRVVITTGLRGAKCWPLTDLHKPS
jgi:hypothetical protein